MPKAKKPIDYRPGSATMDEVKNYERMFRINNLEKDLREVLPSPDFNDHNRLLPMLHLFHQENDRLPRANITLTLTIRSVELLAWLEEECAMKRGKVIDWVLAGLWSRYQEHKDQERQDKLAAARKMSASAGRDDDDEEED